MARKKSFAPLDNLFTLYQTMSVRAIARELGVDRRTVQRWKNQGQKPVSRNAEKLDREATMRRREFAREGRKAREHWGIKKPLPVPIPGDRQFVRQVLAKKEWDEKRERSVRDPKYRTDRFYKRRRKKRVEYVREFDGGAVVFNVYKARDQDILNLIQNFVGEKRGIVLIHRITKWSQVSPKAGITAEWIQQHIGVHMGSKVLDLRDHWAQSADGILDLIRHSRSRGELVSVRITDLNI